jgi:hypothetical protein
MSMSEGTVSITPSFPAHADDWMLSRPEAPLDHPLRTNPRGRQNFDPLHGAVTAKIATARDIATSPPPLNIDMVKKEQNSQMPDRYRVSVAVAACLRAIWSTLQRTCKKLDRFDL